MHTFLMDALCLDCYSDLLLKKGANLEAVVEDIVSVLLLDFLGGVIVVDDIQVAGTPAAQDRLSEHWLHMRATSLNGNLAVSLDRLTARLEEAICCALLDHFHIVMMYTIDIQ